MAQGVTGSFKPISKDGISVHLNPRESKLTKKDIFNIAEIEYDWVKGDNGNVIFDVVATNKLAKKCTIQQLCAVKENKLLVYIVDLGRSNWATLVIVYRDEQYFAYYVDPLGAKVDDNIKVFLRQQNIHCPNIKVNPTDFDTGIFAVKAIEAILQVKEGKVQVKDSFSHGLNRALQNMKPSERNEQLKNEIYKDGKYEKVDSSKNISNKLCQLLKNKEQGSCVGNVFTFIIFSDEIPAATLTVGFRDQQVVAYYVATDSTFEGMADLLSKKGIVPIFKPDQTTALEINNVEMFILQRAKVVRKLFDIPDYITSAKERLDKLNSENVIKETLTRLNARYKIEDKLLRCKAVIDKYIIAHGSKVKPEKLDFTLVQSGSKVKPEKRDFTLVQSNILILFLESIALEDMELSRSLGARLTSIRTRIIGEEDFKVIDLIRSKHLLHRSSKNKRSVINCTDIDRFVKLDVSRLQFFTMLQTYLKQVIDKLHRVKNPTTQDTQSFFKTENDLNSITYKANSKAQIKKRLSVTFKKIVKTNSYSSYDMQYIMFELTVNIIPLLEGLYSDNKKMKNRKIEIEELRNIQIERNELIHNFHKYDSEMARKFELKKYVDKTKSTFFKYVFCQKVYELLNETAFRFSSDAIEKQLDYWLKELSDDFNYVVEEFRDQSETITFKSIAKNMEPSTSGSPLKNFINKYVNLMHFFENENEIQVRKEKYPSLPQRYELLTDNYDKRLYVYEHFNLLKLLCSINSLESEYKLLEVQFRKELKKKCGILKASFDTIVNRYVKVSQNMYGDEFINRIYSDICAIDSEDLKIRDKVESYCKRERSLPGVKVNIDGREISTDMFVKQIIEQLGSIVNRNVFHSLEEAFNDETFLSVLTHNKMNFSRQVWERLLQINCLYPYIVELIVRDQLDSKTGLIRNGFINFDTLNDLIEKILKSEYCATHIKKLLSLDTEKQVKILSTKKQNSQCQECSLEDYFRDFWAISEKELVISKLYELICRKVNVGNIKNIYNLLNDEAHANGILNELSSAIITDNSLNSQENNVGREFLRLVESLCEELSNEEDHASLYKILNVLGLNNLVEKFLQIDCSDPDASKIACRITDIKKLDPEKIAADGH